MYDYTILVYRLSYESYQAENFENNKREKVGQMKQKLSEEVAILDMFCISK